MWWIPSFFILVENLCLARFPSELWLFRTLWKEKYEHFSWFSVVACRAGSRVIYVENLRINFLFSSQFHSYMKEEDVLPSSWDPASARLLESSSFQLNTNEFRCKSTSHLLSHADFSSSSPSATTVAAILWIFIIELSVVRAAAVERSR